MTFPWYVPAGLAVALAGGGVWWGIDHEKANTQAAAQAVTIDRLQARNDTLTRQRDSALKVERRDSIIVIQRETAYVALRDTVLAHDTLFVHDTVTVMRNGVEVKVPFVNPAGAFAACDTTIAAQSLLLNDCRTRAEFSERRAAVSDSMATVYQMQRPDFWQRHEKLICGGAAAAAFSAGLEAGKHW